MNNPHDVNHVGTTRDWLDKESIIPGMNWDTLFIVIFALIGIWSYVDVNMDKIVDLWTYWRELP